ncbi:MAG: type I-E CRISPR-associated protein Cas5/CasD [Deltaproteobacteria bacterium]|nr:type I-E CRISPR-associated protein Cas5/CasD [Deltaproteobacteria bacterium]
MHFVGFRLYAPLASFGDVAVGERRPSLTAPTRSMILGLVAGCLGIRRDQADEQAELERALGVATRTDAPGALLVDYHTAQAPDETRRKAFRKRQGVPIATRREELSATFDKDGTPHALDTQLSQRQYRTDAIFAVCVWLKHGDGPWTVESLAEALRRPVFTPYAGRKAAPLALPFEPALVEADSPVAALRQLRFSLDAHCADRLARGSSERVYRWEGEWPGLTAERGEVRRDRVLSRTRWQFLTRDEHVLSETTSEEASDVPESD